MSHRYVMASFDHESDLLLATKAARLQGWTVVDAYTPYAVHGLDEALELRPSRLTWVCFVCGMLGAIGMLWLEHWTMAIDWPVNVGGKPWNSLPSDVPVAFEAAVLLAGFGSVFALFAVCRLFPGKQARIRDPRVTNDRFVLLIDEESMALDFNEVRPILQKFSPLEIREVVDKERHV